MLKTYIMLKKKNQYYKHYTLKFAILLLSRQILSVKNNIVSVTGLSHYIRENSLGLLTDQIEKGL